MRPAMAPALGPTIQFRAARASREAGAPPREVGPPRYPDGARGQPPFRSSRRRIALPRSSWSMVAPATERAPVARLIRPWISRCDLPVRRATSATRFLRSPRSRSRVAEAASRWGSGFSGGASGLARPVAFFAFGSGSSVGESWRVGSLMIASSSSAPPELTAAGPLPGSPPLRIRVVHLALFLLGVRREVERVTALQLDLVGERLQPGVGRHQEVAHLTARARGGPDEATDHLAEEELGPGRRRIDAGPQAGAEVR